MSAERLLQIKKKIEEAKTKQAEFKGQIDSILIQMEKEFSVKTIVTAEKALDKIEANLETLKTAFDKGLKALEEAHDWS